MLVSLIRLGTPIGTNVKVTLMQVTQLAARIVPARGLDNNNKTSTTFTEARDVESR